MKSVFLCIYILLFGSLSGLRSESVPDSMWTYKTAGQKELQLSVFLPEDYETSTKKYSTIVYFHGGSWRVGDPSLQYPDCEYWSRRGMIAVSVEYRLKERDGVEVPLECVKDAKSAIRYLRKNAEELKVDTEKVVVAGGSAGGQLAAATAVLDHFATNDDCYELSISCKPNAVILYNPFFKCAAELSPPNFVTEGLPPFITFLGDKDPAISVESLESFHEELQEKGGVSEYYVGIGGRHGFCNGRNPRNPFFYWSLEVGDRFLVKTGILEGDPIVVLPKGVKRLEMNTDFLKFD
jgi:acetyl esterase